MSADIVGIIRAVLEGAVTTASAATGLSPAKTREALLAELGDLRATPPRPADVDVDELDAAFERGRASTEPVVPRLRPELLEQVGETFDRAGIYVDALDRTLAPRPLAIVRALEHSALAIALELPESAERHLALDHIKRSMMMVADGHPDSRVTEEPPAPTATVVIDGDAHVVDGPLAYERIVELAGETGSPSVKWSAADGRGGTLRPGAELPNPAGTRITVSHTGNA